MDLYDAHNHFQDPRLDAWRATLSHDLPALGLREMVVNGTCESDWPEVAALARAHPWVRPAFGLHPWRVGERSHRWQTELERLLHDFPHAVVGETGLDRWIEAPDLDAQREAFLFQLDLATRLNRPLTVHCLRAFGWLDELLRVAPALPTRGFLLHSYGGPAEMVPGFVERGAYFSISPYFFHERKRAQRELFQAVPLDRLLIETDAPDMRPPPELNPHPLALPDGTPLNSPANLRFCYEQTAALLGLEVQDLAARVAANYQRWTGEA